MNVDEEILREDEEDENEDGFEIYHDVNGELVTEHQQELMDIFGVETISELESAMDSYDVED